MIAPEENDRWRSLAEELGLPPDSQEQPTSIPSPPRREEPAAAQRAEPIEPPAEMAEEPPARGRRRRGRPAAAIEDEGRGDSPRDKRNGRISGE